MMTSPGPAQVFHTTPTSELVTHFPLALVQAFLVPLAWTLHIVSLWQLVGGSWAATPTVPQASGGTDRLLPGRRRRALEVERPDQKVAISRGQNPSSMVWAWRWRSRRTWRYPGCCCDDHGQGTAPAPGRRSGGRGGARHRRPRLQLRRRRGRFPPGGGRRATRRGHRGLVPGHLRSGRSLQHDETRGRHPVPALPVRRPANVFRLHRTHLPQPGGLRLPGHALLRFHHAHRRWLERRGRHGVLQRRLHAGVGTDHGDLEWLRACASNRAATRSTARSPRASATSRRPRRSPSASPRKR